MGVATAPTTQVLPEELCSPHNGRVPLLWLSKLPPAPLTLPLLVAGAMA
jgi:hypothetical protein